MEDSGVASNLIAVFVCADVRKFIFRLAELIGFDNVRDSVVQPPVGNRLAGRQSDSFYDSMSYCILSIQ
jgi:hypothetical protein